MNLLREPQAPPELPQHLLLHGVDWEEYEKILDALGEHHVRITYDQGDLELMSPHPPHEIYKTFFLRLLDALAAELGIRIKCCGSTTFRRRDRARGLEPDECFYLGSAARVTDWRVIDLTRDPPPDLAVEVDITRSCLNRLGVYAGLGIPEVWRFDGSDLQVHRLAGGAYQVSPVSVALPFLPLREVVPFLHQSVASSDDGELVRALHAWVRTRVLPIRAALAAGQPPPQGNS